MAHRPNSLENHPLFSGDTAQFFGNRRTVTADSIKAQFATEIDWATRIVCDTWEMADRDDVRQEATILVLTYAGLMPGWQNGKLAEWEKTAKDSRAMLSKTLRENLSQVIGRKMEQDYQIVSVEDIPEESHPTYTMEDSIIGRVDSDNGMRKLYPTLCMNTLDGYTQEEIAEIKGVNERTVRRWLTKEKADFENAEAIKNAAFCGSHGLVVEGDETAEELAEAAGYLAEAMANK